MEVSSPAGLMLAVKFMRKGGRLNSAGTLNAFTSGIFFNTPWEWVSIFISTVTLLPTYYVNLHEKYCDWLEKIDLLAFMK